MFFWLDVLKETQLPLTYFNHFQLNPNFNPTPFERIAHPHPKFWI